MIFFYPEWWLSTKIQKIMKIMGSWWFCSCFLQTINTAAIQLTNNHHRAHSSWISWIRKWEIIFAFTRQKTKCFSVFPLWLLIFLSHWLSNFTSMVLSKLFSCCSKVHIQIPRCECSKLCLHTLWTMIKRQQVVPNIGSQTSQAW